MNSWEELFKVESAKPYFIALEQRIASERKQYTIYPKPEDVFKAFALTPYNDVKVVILGQDPYHEVNQAEGLAFSVPDGVKIPASLKNIFKELHDDLGIETPTSGHLEKWARSGVLLLNTILTVREGEALSHQGLGWEKFTDEVIKAINALDHRVVFLLFGNDAIKKQNLITNPKHSVITTSHPSPLSAYRGFLGSRVFSRTNQALIEGGLTPIAW